jgi:hypothetical protein
VSVTYLAWKRRPTPNTSAVLLGTFFDTRAPHNVYERGYIIPQFMQELGKKSSVFYSFIITETRSIERGAFYRFIVSDTGEGDSFCAAQDFRFVAIAMGHVINGT